MDPVSLRFPQHSRVYLLPASSTEAKTGGVVPNVNSNSGYNSAGANDIDVRHNLATDVTAYTRYCVDNTDSTNHASFHGACNNI
jgi:hypothetical protein